MNETVTVSVRELVEFLLRSGDIDNRRKSSGADPELMQLGAAVHRAIQRKQGPEYHPEVSLRDIRPMAGFDLIVEGRADGIINPVSEQAIMDPIANPVTIDEIKTSYRELEYIKAPEEVHLAQAKCYAAIYAMQHELPHIAVRITYCNLDTREVRYFTELYTGEEIISWYEALINMYKPWAQFSVTWRTIRNNSIDALSFPYPYREGQKQLVAQVYRVLTNETKLFIQAPTGAGKTIATVYPTLKAIGEGRAEKMFYLTAKTITRTVALECLQLLRDTGNLRLKSVTVTAKEKICPQEECECNPDNCPYAKGHFDRINDAMYHLLTEYDNFDKETIEKVSQIYMVCPLELSLDMSLFSDAVICDYNYAFDPNVYLRRFFAQGCGGKYYFLVDEAHNLTDRAMNMYSARLYKEQFLEMKAILKQYDARLSRALESCNKTLLSMKRECEEVVVYDDLDLLVDSLMRLMGKIESFLDDHDRDHIPEQKAVVEFYFDLRHFLNIYDVMRKSDYVIYGQLMYDSRFMIRLMCTNPAHNLESRYEKALSVILFSATLLPISYYKDMLGAEKEDCAVYARSVFDPQRRGLFVARDVTSRYTRRNAAEYENMAFYISQTVCARNGNYMIFCPSYAVLSDLYESYMGAFWDEKTQTVICQSANMTEEEKDEFLNAFRDNHSDTLIGFCVLGGAFSEGIDLTEDLLIGAVIVGTGLPMVCRERELLMNKYSQEGQDGFAYAYRYPGMNKVLQAAGRVIRTVNDCGTILLLDDRFLSREYLNLFPREWEDYIPVTLGTVGNELMKFWNKFTD